jgi:hypothetical protein
MKRAASEESTEPTKVPRPRSPEGPPPVKPRPRSPDGPPPPAMLAAGAPAARPVVVRPRSPPGPPPAHILAAAAARRPRSPDGPPPPHLLRRPPGGPPPPSTNTTRPRSPPGPPPSTVRPEALASSRVRGLLHIVGVDHESVESMRALVRHVRVVPHASGSGQSVTAYRASLLRQYLAHAAIPFQSTASPCDVCAYTNAYAHVPLELAWGPAMQRMRDFYQQEVRGGGQG